MTYFETKKGKKLGQEGIEGKNIFPPISYFFKILKRHFFWILIGTLPVLILVIWGLSQTTLEYRSTSTLVYDPRDSTISSNQVRYPDFDQIANSYYSIPQDTELLDQIAERLVLNGEGFVTFDKPFYQKILSGILPSEIIPNAWLLEGQFYQQMVIRNNIAQALQLGTTPTSFEFNLETRAETPQEAQRLNEIVMEAFVVRQLGRYREKIQANLVTLEGHQEKEKQKIDGLGELFNLYSDDNPEKPLKLSSKQKKSLKDRERNLVNQILSTQREQEQTLSSEIQRKLDLEGQLAQLLTQKGPTHPEVTQKNQELQKIKSSRATDVIKNKINTLTRRLIELQVRMKRAGIPIDNSLQLRNLAQDAQLFLARLGQLVKEHTLELENIDQQIQNPDTRTRFRYSVPPSLENGLANKKNILLMMAIGAILIFGTTLSILLFREFYSPKIMDAWKFRLANPSVPVIAELDSANARGLARMPLTTLSNILGSNKQNKLATSVQLIRKAFADSNLKKPGIYYISSNGSHPFFKSLGEFLGSVAALGQRSIVLDLRNEFSSVSRDHDLISFLQGRCKWKDIRIGRTKDRPFDIVGAKDSHQSVGIFNKEGFSNLLQALQKQYDIILISGFSGQYFVENSMISKHADHWIEFVDLGSTDKVSSSYNANQEGHKTILIST